MNATVERIVELLFEDLEMTEEVLAMKDEVMNNCQERFEDLVASGMDTDDAIGAVVESLKGMEEVLREYPRKDMKRDDRDEDSAYEDDEDDNDVDRCFPASAVRKIMVKVVEADVNVESSMDEDVHVYYCREEIPNAALTLEGGTLSFNDMNFGKEKPSGSKVHFNTKTNFGKINSFEDIGRMLKNLRIQMQFSGGGSVTVSIPDSIMPEVEISTVEGSIDIDGVKVSALLLNSVNGDQSVYPDQAVQVRNASISTISGDVEATLGADQCVVSTMSGDVELEGRLQGAKVNTVSGDVNIRADVVTVDFKTVSGDVSIDCDSNEVRGVFGTTTSGDIDVHVPGDVEAKVNARSTSGDVSQNIHYRAPYAAQVTLKSISGDIHIA